MAGGMLRFDGRVAVVTGGGGGLGRQYALQLAERGAAVVVNDLGGSRSGDGKSTSAADKVVNEIKAKGGKAVADYHSVEEGDKIIQTAISNFGRVDILINNAGILRDKSFLKLTDSDWDLVHKVHLKGAFLTTRAAWPYFRNQKYGRIIMTSSGAGVYGNFGQANYSSAKLGLVGLSNTLAIEGKKYNIHCNTIIPVAASRLTEDILPKDFLERLKPEYVSPVVVWLLHESCPENGGIFEAAGGWVGKYSWHRSIGKAFADPGKMLTPEAVRDEWSIITDMTGAQSPANIAEHTGLLLDILNHPDEDPRNTSMIEDDSKTMYTFGPDDLILYALGVGATTRDPDDLKYLYEGSADFCALPTFGVIPSMPAVLEGSLLREEVKKMGLQLNFAKLLHGEQYLEVLQPLPTSGTLFSELSDIDIVDKGSGAVVIGDVDTYNDAGEKVLYTQWTLFFVGSGNFGGKRTSAKAKEVVPPPNREPDASVTERTSSDQSALYRLSGDKNPMHIDPAFAAISGFDQPIIHGLCTLGFAARHVLKQYAGNDPSKFKAIKVRFAKPLLPGQTIRTDMWQEGNRIHLQCTSVETGQPVLTGGYVDLVNIPDPRKMYAAPAEESQSANLKSEHLFTHFAKRLKNHPDLSSEVQAIYEWNVLKNGKPAAQWTLDLKNGAGGLYRGPCKDGKANCILTMEDDHLYDMAFGKLDPQKAFMSGKLRIRGNVLLAQKLQPLFEAERDQSPLEQKFNASSGGGGGGGSSGGAPPPAASSSGVKLDPIFENLAKRVRENTELVDIVRTVYGWKVTKDGKVVSEWTVDLKNSPGTVYRGPYKNGKADCTIILDDDLGMELFEGKQDATKAFMSGKIRITGNVLAAQKLQVFWGQQSMLVKDGISQDATAAPSNPPPPSGDAPAPPGGSHPEPEASTGLKCDFVFSIFQRRMYEEPELINKMRVIFHFFILKNGKVASEWTVDTKSTKLGEIYRGPPKTGRPDCTVTVDDDDVIRMLTGKMNPQRAFMMGKLKIKGNIMITQKLNTLWHEVQKMGKVPELPMVASILQHPMTAGLKSEYLFLEMVQRLVRQPQLHMEVPKIVEFKVFKDGKQMTHWTLDLKKGKGVVHRGPPKTESDAVVLIEDEEVANLFAGRYTAQQLLSSGRLKIEGESDFFPKLQPLFKMYVKL